MQPLRSRKHPTRCFEGLVTNQWISGPALQSAVDEAVRGTQDLESLLIDTHNIPEHILRTSLSEFYGCPALPEPDGIVVDQHLLKHLNFEYLNANDWVPLRHVEDAIEVAIHDPKDLRKCLDIEQAFPRRTIRFAVGLRRDIQRLLLRAAEQARLQPISVLLAELTRDRQQEAEEDEDALVHGNNSTIVRLANQIISDAHRAGASDVHIEPQPGRKDTTIRFRVDGSCLPYTKIPPTCQRAIVSRVKIMANLDIAERRKPQDGKIRFKLGSDREIELRVATIPTSGFNEDVVLRLLTGKGPIPLDAMDLSERALLDLKRIADKPYGIILCVGPTGSGKTTTLHALMNFINTQDRKIWTAEDPIEISQEGLRQVQVHPKIGFTFAAAMRAFLRADPDVIMIGEMRDKETADIALEASLTGHLVLSTLHTNSSVETVIRLLDLGCDPFNFADAMLGVLAKRLCKRLCSRCKESYRPQAEERDELMRSSGIDSWEKLGIARDDPFTLFRPVGCGTCNGTGFQGRLALHELLLGSGQIRGLIQAKATTGALLKAATEEGMTTLIQDGLRMVLKGQTTFAQVHKVAIK